MWPGMGHSVHGFLRWVKRDLVRFAPLVQPMTESTLALCSNSLIPFKSSA